MHNYAAAKISIFYNKIELDLWKIQLASNFLEHMALTPDRLKAPVFGLCEMIRFYSIIYVLMVLGCIVFERTLATIKLESYENWIKDWFFLLSASIQICLSTIITAKKKTKTYKKIFSPKSHFKLGQRDWVGDFAPLHMPIAIARMHNRY